MDVLVAKPWVEERLKPVLQIVAGGPSISAYAAAEIVGDYFDQLECCVADWTD